jgi:hypothetical protein
MSHYGPPTVPQTIFTPTTAEIPADPVIGTVVNGPNLGEATVPVIPPTLSTGGPPLTVPVTQMTLFWSLSTLATYDINSLFALSSPTIAKKTQTVPIPNPLSGIATVPVTSGGNYLTVPTVVFTGGGGSGAVATAVLIPGVPNFAVGSIVVTNPGSGYTSIPAVSFTGGGETVAAVAVSTITPITVDFNISGLAPGSPYFFRAAAATE